MYPSELAEEPGTPGSGFGFGYSGPLGYPTLACTTVRDPSALATHAYIDEREAIEACQEEWLATTRRHVKKKERQALACRLLSVGEQPGQDFFRLLAGKLQEYQVATPTVQIEYRNLTVRTDAFVGSAGIPTAGNFAPRLIKAALGLNKGHMKQLTILDGLNGVLKPGRCTLLLGPPGSGKTTFLRVLGNRLRGCNRLQVSGEVLYNGHTANEFVVERTTAFVDQHDSHIPNLSVAETIEFAHTCHRGYREPEFSLSGELCKAKVVRSVAGMNQQLQQQQVVQLQQQQQQQHQHQQQQHWTGDSLGSSGSPRSHSLGADAPLPTSGGSGASELGAGGLEHVLALDEIEQLITEVWGTGAKTEVVLRLLGLGNCRDTLVGDGGLMLRGISGGERKRLTTAEMVVGPQRVLLMDEISTGLDSATLHSVVSFFTAMSRALNLTTVISLLQPPPEVFALFDDLLLLCEGRLLYHGPLQGALPHFTAQGFLCPVRKDVPSFLLEITTPAGQMEFASKQLICSVHARGGPDTPGGMLVGLREMAARFWGDSAAGTAMLQQLAEPFDRATSHPAALEKRRYALSPLQAVSVATRRQMKLVMRDKVLLRGRILQIIVVSLMVGSLFWQLGHGVSDARSFYGASFMAVLFMAMGSMPQIGVVMATKAVWLKHRNSRLYPGYAHGVAMALSQLPVSLLEATLFSGCIYFMVGFYRDVTAFFVFWGIVAAANLCLSALFRLLAVLAPNPTLAAAYGGVALLLLILTSGFAIVRGSIPVYWIWVYYISPFAYALRAIVINEFSSPPWGSRVIGVPGARTLGQAALLSYDFATSRAWIAYGVAFLLGAYLVLSALTCLALDWVTGPTQVARLPDPRQLAAVRLAAERRRCAAHAKLAKKAERALRSTAARSTSAGGSSIGLALSSLGGAHQALPQSRGVASGRGSGLSYAGGTAAALLSGTGGGAGLLGSGFSGGLGMLRSAMYTSERPSECALSDVPSVASLQSIAITLAQRGLDFTPISLVFEDLRYFVPNPAFKAGCCCWGRGGPPAGAPVDPGFAPAGFGPGPTSAKLALLTNGASWQSVWPAGSGMIKAGSQPGSPARGSSGPRRRTASSNGRARQQQQQQQQLDMGRYARESGSGGASSDGGGSGCSTSSCSGGAAGEPWLPGTPVAVPPCVFGLPPGLAHSAAACSSAPCTSAPPRELELLKGVSGFAVPGKLMALMGGSGAGKTTLMDVICGRKTVGRTTGRLLANGRPIVKAAWSRVVGYVEQMDVHTPAQTVIEALWFSGRLRLGPHVSNQQVRAYVEQVIDTVDLTDQSFSLVGLPAGGAGVGASGGGGGGNNAGGGLSTEQLKRLTIAVELVANPSVVFMDEPTSGLDARAAAIVMRAVRNVANSGRTVMVTIHQPSIEIFEAFDTLLLLQRGGRTTYFGPLGHESTSLIAYLQSVPGTCPILPGANPATWMLEVTGGSMAVTAALNSTDWPGLYAASALAAANAAASAALVREGLEAGPELQLGSMYAQPARVQLRELLLKFWRVYWRTPSYTLARCALTLAVAGIYGSMYYRAGQLPRPYATMGSIQNVMGIIFSSTSFLGMTNLMAVMPLVGMERVVFYRERGALPYDPFAYGTAIALVEVPWLLLQALLFVPVMYVLVGFTLSLDKAGYYFAMFLASLSFYTILGQFMVYITPSQQIAQVVGAGLNFVFNIFNGFVIAAPAMPHYWRWLNKLVPTTWVLYGLGVSQLGDVGQLVAFAGRRVPVQGFVASLFGYHYDMRWWCAAIVLGYVVFFRVSSILALKYVNFLRR